MTDAAASSSSSAVTDDKLPDTLNKHWKNDKTGFGFRMLQKMGWQEDKGLGKDESGIIDAIRVKKREQGMALGANEQDYREAGWNATAVGFSQVLGLLKQEYGTGTGHGTDDDDDDDYRGEGKDKKERKKRKKEKKKDKKKDKEKKVDREKKPKKKVPIMQVGMKQHYKKHLAAKDVKSKTEQEKLSIFGSVGNGRGKSK